MTPTPRELVAAIDRSEVPAGIDERFSGYGIMAQPFRSGHVLALRRFPHTSIGPAYTSVWHCDPRGRWTMWNDAPPMGSCPRYFGPALAACDQRAIGVEWLDSWTVHVQVDGVLDWRTTVGATAATRAMTAIGGHLPGRLWRSRAVLAGMGRVAGPMLGAGAIRLYGTVPSRQWFRVRIPRVWAVTDVEATLRHQQLGPQGPTDPQRWLGGFALPNRGLFAIGQATFQRYQPEHHVQAVPALAV